MRKPIINCNIIISTLFRDKGIYLYNKQKDDIDFDIKDKVKFTKGYTVCIHHETVDKMKSYEYYRKTISNVKDQYHHHHFHHHQHYHHHAAIIIIITQLL